MNMLLKASLHIHTSEDKRDGHMINYDVYKLIDEAHRKGFNVLGFTPHQKFVFQPEFADYAFKKGILLIPGIERSLGRVLNQHVIILNCDKTVEKVKSFKQLAEYKADHPEIFILAPHPTYSRLLSMGKRNLRKNISMFDAVEYSWIYSKRYNKNRKAEAIAREANKPMISTADVHMLRRLDTDYALIDVDHFTLDGVFNAIKQGRFENITMPKKLFSLITYIFRINTRYVLRYIERKVFGVDLRTWKLAEEVTLI